MAGVCGETVQIVLFSGFAKEIILIFANQDSAFFPSQKDILVGAEV